jgi:hypothetical protein
MGDAAYVNFGNDLDSYVLDGRYDIGRDIFSVIYHSLPRALNSEEKTVMSFDTYATTTYPISHNTVIGLGVEGDGAKLFWNPLEETINSGMWSFDARGVTGNSADYQRIGGGYDQPVSLKIMIDGPAGEVYGLYNFGSGEQETQHYSVSTSTIETLNAVFLNLDFRSPTAASTPLGSQYFGIELDNILVEVSADESLECPVTLSSALDMHIPVLEFQTPFETMLLKVNMSYVDLSHSEDINFEVVDYETITSIPTHCAPATLSEDLSNLHLPKVIFGDFILSADLEFAPIGDRIMFKVIDYQIIP